MRKSLYRAFAIAFCLLASGIWMTVSAQTQTGYVKTIGRPGKPGVPLGNVTIRMRGLVNQVLSSPSGEFRINMPGKKDGDAVVLQSVQKNGYELKDNGLIGRPMVFSSRVPIEILMVDKKQLAADKKRIEDNAYRTAEKNYQKKKKQLEEQKNKNEISAERYRQELLQLQESFEKYQSLISDMADRYARTDYDQLDSIDRQINLYIEEGELDKADSLIHTVFDPTTVLERNRAAKEEIRQRIAFAQSIIDKAQADRVAILRDMDYAGRIVELCSALASEYMAQGENEKAKACLTKGLEIATILHGEDHEEVKAIRQLIKNLEQ